MRRIVLSLFFLGLAMTIPLADALAQPALRGAVVGGVVGGRRGAAIGAATGAAVGAHRRAVGTAIMVIGAGIISIIGVTAVAGYALQAADRIRYRIDIAAEPAFCHHDPRTDLRWCADASGRS